MHHLSALSCGIRGAENGFARIYARGTNTRVTYYTNFEATVSSTADITLNSRGQATTYVNQLVKVVIFDSDGNEVIRWDDGVSATAVEIISPSVVGTDYTDASTGVNKPTTFQAFLALWIIYSGGQPWPLVDPFDTGTGLGLAAAIGLGQGGEFNVKKYGALGDGTTNDTASITAAIAAAENAGGGVVVFPTGIYIITAALVLPANVCLRGSGRGATTIAINSATLSAIDVNSGYVAIRDLTIVASQSNSGTLITADGCQLVIDTCALGGAFSTGIVLGIGMTTLAVASVQNCQFSFPSGTAVGINSATLSRIKVSGCEFTLASAGANTGTMVGGSAGAAFNISNCLFNPTLQSSGTSYGVRVQNLGVTTVTSCHFAAPGGGTANGIIVDTGGQVLEAANQFGGYPYSVPTGATMDQASISFQSRPGFSALVTNDTAGAQTVDALRYGLVVWRRTTNGTQTPTLAVAPVGSRLTLVWWNDHGAGGGTITLASASGAIRTEFASDQFTVAANSIRVISFIAMVINGAFRWVQDGESTDDETE